MGAVPGSTATSPRTMPNPMKKALLAVFSLLITTLGCAAADHTESNDNLCLNYVGDHPFYPGSKWGLHLESQFHLAYMAEPLQRLLLLPGSNYTIPPALTFLVGADLDVLPLQPSEGFARLPGVARTQLLLHIPPISTSHVRPDAHAPRVPHNPPPADALRTVRDAGVAYHDRVGTGRVR